MKIGDRTENAIKIAAAVLAIVATLLAAPPFDWVDALFDTEAERARATLASVLGLATAIYIFLYFREKSVDNRLEEAKAAANAQAEATRAELKSQRDYMWKIRDNSKLVDTVEGQIANLPDKNAIKLTNFIGPYLAQRLRTILTEKHFDIKGGVLFQEFYRHTFRTLEGPCDILATALADYKYHWGADDLNKIFYDFTHRPGCSLTRIFILQDRALLDTKDAQTIMTKQAEAGVNVLWITREALSEPMRLLIADKQRTLSWQLQITHDNTIEEVEASWDPIRADERYKYAERLLNRATPFVPASAMEQA